MALSDIRTISVAAPELPGNSLSHSDNINRIILELGKNTNHLGIIAVLPLTKALQNVSMNIKMHLSAANCSLLNHYQHL